MGVSLTGVEAWRASDELPPGAYVSRPANVERDKSSSGNPQVLVDWRVAGGEFKGAEKRDWVTLTEPAMGRIVQLIEACGEQVPQEDFASYDELADWLAGMLKKDSVLTELVVREEPWTGKDGETRMGTKVKGYRRPGPGSDIPSDASEFQSGAKVATDAQGKPLPF
jgi:hypothetical protein